MGEERVKGSTKISAGKAEPTKTSWVTIHTQGPRHFKHNAQAKHDSPGTRMRSGKEKRNPFATRKMWKKRLAARAHSQGGIRKL